MSEVAVTFDFLAPLPEDIESAAQVMLDELDRMAGPGREERFFRQMRTTVLIETMRLAKSYWGSSANLRRVSHMLGRPSVVADALAFLADEVGVRLTDATLAGTQSGVVLTPSRPLDSAVPRERLLKFFTEQYLDPVAGRWARQTALGTWADVNLLLGLAQKHKAKVGDVLRAQVVHVGTSHVTVDVGDVVEGIIPIEPGGAARAVGDVIDAEVVSVLEGGTLLMREHSARRAG